MLIQTYVTLFVDSASDECWFSMTPLSGDHGAVAGDQVADGVPQCDDIHKWGPTSAVPLRKFCGLGVSCAGVHCDCALMGAARESVAIVRSWYFISPFSPPANPPTAKATSKYVFQLNVSIVQIRKCSLDFGDKTAI